MTEPGQADEPDSPATRDGDELESSDEHLYFLAIEKVFIDERGAPLYLSPKDWLVARAWYEAGIPLEWVERTIRELFEKRRARGTDDKLVSLGYCRRSVEAAWKRQQKLAVPDVEAPAIDVAARLAALAAALPATLASRGDWARRLTALQGGAEEVESKLQELDRELLEAATAGLGEAARARLDDALASALAKLARRLPEAELAGVETQIAERLLREHLALPVLSLFAPEAEAPSDD